MRCDVEDSGFGVFERRADVEALPGCFGVETRQSPVARHRVERAADAQRRRRQHCRRPREQPGPQQPGHRQRRHPQRGAHRRRPPKWNSLLRRRPAGGREFRFVALEPDHVGAVGDRRFERGQDPGGGVGDLGQRGDRLGAGRGGLRVARRRVDRRRGRRARRRATRTGRWPARRRGSRCGPGSASWIAELKVADAASQTLASARVRPAGRRAASPRRARSTSAPRWPHRSRGPPVRGPRRRRGVRARAGRRRRRWRRWPAARGW